MPTALLLIAGPLFGLAPLHATALPSAPIGGKPPTGLGSQIVSIRVAPDEDAPTETPSTSVGQRYPWTFPRATTDRPDEAAGKQIHVVYLVPTDQPDEELDVLGVLEDSLLAQNVWLRGQTGGRSWRLDTYTFVWDDPATPEEDPVELEGVDVSFLRALWPASRYGVLEGVRSELRLRGFRDPDKRYLVYSASGAGNVCGSGYLPPDPDDPASDGQYAVIYLDSNEVCRSREFAPGPFTPSHAETITMQELMHNDGMVPAIAPHQCLLASYHVCTPGLQFTDLDPERPDVMFPYVGLPLSDKKLDEDHLDYFEHSYPSRDFDQSPFLETPSPPDGG